MTKKTKKTRPSCKNNATKKDKPFIEFDDKTALLIFGSKERAGRFQKWTRDNRARISEWKTESSSILLFRLAVTAWNYQDLDASYERVSAAFDMVMDAHRKWEAELTPRMRTAESRLLSLRIDKYYGEIKRNEVLKQHSDESNKNRSDTANSRKAMIDQFIGTLILTTSKETPRMTNKDIVRRVDDEQAKLFGKPIYELSTIKEMVKDMAPKYRKAAKPR